MPTNEPNLDDTPASGVTIENTDTEPKRPRAIRLRDLALKDRPKAKASAARQKLEEDQEDDLHEEDLDKSLMELQEVLESNDLIGGSVRLERRGPMDNGFAYIGKMKTNVFDIEQIKKMYGGGDYQAQFFRANGQIAKKVGFSIDSRFQGLLDSSRGGVVPGDGRDDISKTLVNAVVSRDRADPAAANMMTSMMRSQQESTSLLVTMMMESSKQNMAMITAMMSAMAQAFSTKNVTPTDGLKVADILALVPLLKGDGSKTPTITELADALLKLKQISDIGGTDDAPKSALDKIAAMMPHVANTVAALRGQPMLPAGEQAPPVGGPEVNGQEPKALPAPSSSIEIALALVMHAARRKADVGLYHDMLLDAVGEDQIPMLQQALTPPEWFTTLFGKQPDAAEIQPWLTELRNAILITLKAESDGPSNDSLSDGSAGKSDSAGIQPAHDSSGAGTG